MTRLSRNLAFNIAGQTANLVLGALAVRYIYRGLGSDVFGLIFFNLTISAAVTSVLDLGISTSVVREVSTHFDADAHYITAAIRTASTLYWCLYFAMLIAAIAVAPVLARHWLHLSSIDSASAVTMLRVLSAGTLLLLPQALYMSLLRGRQRMGLVNLLTISTFALQQAGIVAILALHGGLGAIIAWILLSSCLEVCAFGVACALLFSWSALLPGWSVEVIRRNLVFVKRMFSVTVTSMIFTQSDKVAVSRLLSVADFGFYSFISSICARASALGVAVADAALPSLSALASARSSAGVQSLYRKLQDFLCVVALPVLTAIVFAAPFLYRYVFGPEVADRLLLPTALLALGFFMNATLVVPYITCLATGRPEVPARGNIVALPIILPTTVLLVWRFGIVGGGLSWVAYNLFCYLYFVPRACQVCIPRSPVEWYSHVGRIALLGLMSYGSAWILALGGDTLARTALLFIAASVAYSVGAYFLLGPELRATLVAAAGRLPHVKRMGAR